jgi:Zn-finger nucleic acid-binding protein
MPTELACAVCGTPMHTIHHEGVELDACPAGCGVWLDPGELRQVVASEDQPRPRVQQLDELERARGATAEVMSQVASEAVRPCPRCGGALRKRDYPGSTVVMDVCAEHGYWLDAGELQRIEAFAEGTRALANEGGRRADGEPPAPGFAVRGVAVPADVLRGMLHRGGGIG